MTITSDGGDYPDVRLERIPLSAVDKSQILEEEVNGMVLYKPDYARISNVCLFCSVGFKTKPIRSLLCTCQFSNTFIINKKPLRVL